MRKYGVEVRDGKVTVTYKGEWESVNMLHWGNSPKEALEQFLKLKQAEVDKIELSLKRETETIRQALHWLSDLGGN